MFGGNGKGKKFFRGSKFERGTLKKRKFGRKAKKGKGFRSPTGTFQDDIGLGKKREWVIRITIWPHFGDLLEKTLKTFGFRGLKKGFSQKDTEKGFTNFPFKEWGFPRYWGL